MALSSAASLAGKVAIITGGSSGIGLAIVNLFLKAGAKVAVFDIQSNETLATADNFSFFKTNIASEEHLKSAVSELITKWGKIDVLVNNAGIMDKMCMLRISLNYSSV
jgi:NAD(P)-dependent dehydrogenase (short-subunit alcohol dehydrogenase family)